MKTTLPLLLLSLAFTASAEESGNILSSLVAEGEMNQTPAAAVEAEPLPAPESPKPDLVATEPEPVVAEPAPAVAEPEPAPVVAEPEPAPVVTEPEPAPVVAEPEPAPVAVEPEPVVAEPESTPAPVLAETPAVTEEAIPALPAPAEAAPGELVGEQQTDEIDLEEIDDAALAAKRPQVKPAVVGGPVSLVDIDCDEATLADILRQFRKATGANIISCDSTNLHKRVSVTLRRVPWLQALSSILSSRNFRLDENMGIYRVVEDAHIIPLVTQTFQLNHASSKELSDLFNATYARKDAQGKVIRPVATYFEGANVVVVTADEKTISDCATIVKAVDKAVAQIYIEARFMELSSDAMHKLGVQWDKLESWSVGVKNLKGGWQTSSGSAADYNTYGTYTKKNMVKTGSSYSSSSDGSTSSSTSSDTYTDLADGALAIGRSILTPSSIDEATGAGLSAADMAWSRAAGFSGQLSASDFSLALSAFEQLGEGQIFSNPKIIVSNGKEAKVDMTTKEPNVAIDANYTGTSSQNLSISTKLEVIPGEDKQMFAKEAFFSYGITLSVKPRISPDGLISVEIVPTISEKKEDKEVKGASEGTIYTTYPVINVKRLTTEFTMKDGATAVIGGLTRTEEKDIDSGIPYLRDIPWIGPWLFGWKSRAKEQSEIIVFVTVGIANPAELPKDIGLPKNAVMGREFVEGRRQEPGDRKGTADRVLSVDTRPLDEQRAERKAQNEKKEEGNILIRAYTEESSATTR